MNVRKPSTNPRNRPADPVADLTAKCTEKDGRRQRDSVSRKRAQNRLSQQCFREKNRVRAKQLETLGELIKSSADSTIVPSAEQYKDLLNKQFALMEENSLLRDALLKMRKKLLSLSSAATAAADDPAAVDLLLKRSAPTGSEVLHQTERIERASETNLAPGEVHEGNPPSPGEPMQEVLRHTSLHVNSGLAVNELDALDFAGLYDPPQDSPESACALWPMAAMSMPSTATVHVVPDDPGFTDSGSRQGVLSLNSFIFTAPTMPPAALYPDGVQEQRHVVPQWQFVPDSDELTQRSFTLHTTDYWTVEEACMRYLAQLIDTNLPHSTLGFVRGLGPLHSDPAKWNPLRLHIGRSALAGDVIDNLVRIGTELISKSSGLAHYIYGVGVNDYMEKILRWRISPTPQNRQAIPEPFCPTPLQLASRNTYCAVIDTLTWPSIRDQLIEQAGTYDLASIVSDIVEHTVIEVAGLGGAISVHDTFCSHIFAQNANSAEIDEPALPAPYSLQATLQRIGLRMQSMPYVEPSHPSSLSQWPYQRLSHKQPLATVWGLDKYLQRKLSMEFAATHLFLDCSGGTLSFCFFPHFP
ncbi:hypothetical protein EDD37DRAFT_670344 [Exophiala viscosa]|uniref:uncharacterized protein n=1 Tax=Exophiala viscosa TaxID=2486360 RepID=UPI0021A21BD0|nr:hypothetical protein EDD37DRAFT_670344 [Exophiala viscosa]